MKNEKSNIIFDNVDEFIHYIIQNLSREINFIKFNIINIENMNKLAYGSIRYIENIINKPIGYIVMNILKDSGDIYSTIEYPILISNNICENLNSIKLIYNKLENMLKKDNNKLTYMMYTIKTYDDRYNNINKKNTLCINEIQDIGMYIIDSIINRTSNTFSIIIYINDYIYNIIIDIIIISILDRFDITIKFNTTENCENYDITKIDASSIADIDINVIIDIIKNYINDYIENINHDIDKIIFSYRSEKYA